jgi:hypothetical protein
MSRAPRLYSHQIIKMRTSLLEAGAKATISKNSSRGLSDEPFSVVRLLSPLATCVTEAKNGHDGLTSSFGSSVSWSACEHRSTKLFAIPILIRLGI